MNGLEIVPITRKEAQTFVKAHHRHLGPVTGAIFQIACADKETQAIVGVALVGRPIATSLDDGWTLEVNRCATDGTKNACSMLYAAAWRVARNLGYRKLITYTHKSESGASLRGAGWNIVGQVTRSPKWHNRPTIDTKPFQEKFRWEISN